MSRTALILVDVINDFFHPDGSNYHAEYLPILENIKFVLSQARWYNLMIVHATEEHIPGHPDFEWRKLPEHNLKDSFSASIVTDIPVEIGEYHVTKRRYSAFFATDLDLILRERGIEKVFLVGVKTHVCVRATAQDAFAYGYDVYVIEEAVGSNHEHLHYASLEDIDRYMGQVISMNQAFEMFAAEKASGEDE